MSAETREREQASADSDRMEISFPGHSWIAGQSAPDVAGWQCFFVTHIGVEKTTYHYRKARI